MYPGRSPGFEDGLADSDAGRAAEPAFADMPRYVGRQDANWDPMSFDLDTDLALALKNAGFIEASDPDPGDVQGARRQAAAVSRLGRPRPRAREHDQLLRRT